MSEGTTRAVLAAFAGNLAIAITKAIAAYLTGSGALVAETAHSIADSVNQILLYVGIRRSVQPPTEKHPLGHGKERYFWALIVALFLFFGGGLFSIYEAYERFTHPQELGAVWVGFVVLGLSILMDLLVFRPLRTQSPAVMLVATFAVAFLLQSIALLAFGPLGKIASSLAPLNRPVDIGTVHIRKIAIVAVVTSLGSGLNTTFTSVQTALK